MVIVRVKAFLVDVWWRFFVKPDKILFGAETNPSLVKALNPSRDTLPHAFDFDKLDSVRHARLRTIRTICRPGSCRSRARTSGRAAFLRGCLRTVCRVSPAAHPRVWRWNRLRASVRITAC